MKNVSGVRTHAHNPLAPQGYATGVSGRLTVEIASAADDRLQTADVLALRTFARRHPVRDRQRDAVIDEDLEKVGTGRHAPWPVQIRYHQAGNSETASAASPAQYGGSGKD